MNINEGRGVVNYKPNNHNAHTVTLHTASFEY